MPKSVLSNDGASMHMGGGGGISGLTPEPEIKNILIKFVILPFAVLNVILKRLVVMYSVGNSYTLLE